MKSQFLIAAPTSGSGKTTVARGLMALLSEKGYKVQPFKCGPDYIDTKFHESVCNRPSVNLDTFMATSEHVRELFAHYGADADVCIVEGMMGLFDGYDRDKGSSAEIAKVLDIPVVLVVDARSAAYSTAALLSGFIHFREDIRIAGVIFNKVGSARHFQMLQQVCDDLGIRCFGYLPKHPSLEQDSRYLGLDFSQRSETMQLLEQLDRHVNWEDLVVCLRTDCAKPQYTMPQHENSHVLIARNTESFSFLYQEAVDSFPHVEFFDPERDVPSFDGIDLLYLPGGYPEKHLEALTGNEACRMAIKAYAEKGGRVIAECGGMMYLCQHIVTDDGAYPMCGVLPYSITARRADRRLTLGYRRFVLDGKEYRGHEFHYTQFSGQPPTSVAQVYNAKGEPVDTPVFRSDNVLASYTHLYQI
jgi:cobyrinic acid a,c-diamide synthase